MANETETEKEMKEALMAQGKKLGINIHVNTSVENMLTMVNQALIYTLHKAPDAPVKQKVIKDKALARKEATRLIRVRVTNMDPTKTKHTAQTFGFSNSVVGTIQRVVPLDIEEGFHIPQVLIEVIKSAKYRQTRYRTINHRGQEQEVPYSVEVPSFSVEVLPPITAKELHDIKQRQMAEKTIS